MSLMDLIVPFLSLLDLRLLKLPKTTIHLEVSPNEKLTPHLDDCPSGLLGVWALLEDIRGQVSPLNESTSYSNF